MTMKVFNKFTADVPKDFEEKMINFWMEDENSTREEVIYAYHNHGFDDLLNRLPGTNQTFIPDLGYEDKSIDGTVCFEEKDNNVVIPISILTNIVEL